MEMVGQLVQVLLKSDGFKDANPVFLFDEG